MLPLPLLFLPLLAHPIAANPRTSPALCMNSIITALSSFTFASAPNVTDDYYTNLCTNTLGVHSLWLAASTFCTPSELTAGTKVAETQCAYGDIDLVPYSSVQNDFSESYIRGLPVVEFVDIDEQKVWNTSVVLEGAFYEEARRTYWVFEDQYEIHARYGWAMYGFWGGMLVLGMATRFLDFLLELRRGSGVDVESTTLAMRSRAMTRFDAVRGWFRTHLVIPAAFGNKHQQLVWKCSIPTRLEGLVVAAFWVLSIVLLSVSYEVFEHNLYYTYPNQIWRYLSDRAGIICYANLPILWIFSGRNNVFLWATGWKFSTFNSFHRTVARVAVLEAVIHSVGWSVLEWHEGYFSAEWHEQYWYMGGMATVTMSLLLVFSSVFLRQRCYEVFLIMHIVLSIVTIVGLFFHTKIFDGAYDPYLWPLVAIWCFDRLMRIVRVIYCNLHIKLSGRPQGTRATAVYDEASDLIRLEIVPGSKLLAPKPNQHYFLYQPVSWKGWENHPFTLAGWTSGKTNTAPMVHGIAEDPKSDVQKPVVHSYIMQSDSSLSSRNEGLPSEQTLTFLIRPSSGWTKRLKNACSQQPNIPLQTPILIEGPYGHSVPLQQYENILFITGGTGIAGATSYLQEHFALLSAGSPTRTANISLIWACKQEAMIHSVAAKELSSTIGNTNIKTSFFVTSASTELKPMPHEGQGVEIRHGRPDVERSVLDFVAEAGGGQTAVLVCGPAAMADEARAAVYMALRGGRQEVDYFEETFGW